MKINLPWLTGKASGKAVLLGRGMIVLIAAVIIWRVVIWVYPGTISGRPKVLAAPRPVVQMSLPPYQKGKAEAVLAPLAQIRTYHPDRPRFEIYKYKVQKGDTPWSIAQKFKVHIETILWGNIGMDPDSGMLREGSLINILPVDGVLHIVEKKDTWVHIESLYGVSMKEITAFPGNGYTDSTTYDLPVGKQLIIPGGKKPLVWQDPGPQVVPGLGRKSPGYYDGPLAAMGTGNYDWPVYPVLITQPYWTGHVGIDINAYVGMPVHASDNGTVIFAGWSQAGYGNLVIIDHGTGYWSYYAHNSNIIVSVGQGVVQGQEIAEAGSTGRSTGPHVHFAIRVAGGAFIDPTPLLPLAP